MTSIRRVAPFLLLLVACSDDRGLDPADTLPDIEPDASVDAHGDATPEPDRCVDSAPRTEIAGPVEDLERTTCQGSTHTVRVQFTEGPRVELAFVDPLDALSIDATVAGVTVERRASDRGPILVLQRTPGGPLSADVVVDAPTRDVTWRLAARYLPVVACEPSPSAALAADGTSHALTVCEGPAITWTLVATEEDELDIVIARSAPVGPMRVEVGRTRDGTFDVADERVSEATEIVAGVAPGLGTATIRVSLVTGTAESFALRATAGPPTGPPVAVRVDGILRYEDRPYTSAGFLPDALAPVDSARVELVQASDGRIVAEGRTSADGTFSMSGEARPGAQLRVRALAQVDVEGHRTRVVNRASTPAIYAITSASIEVGDADGVWDAELLATRASGAGGAFNIADVSAETARFLLPWVEATAPDLTMQWEAGLPFACGACYSRNRVSLGGGEADPDEYDDDIIFHEYGHHFVQWYSRDDSPGGPHRDRRVSPALAFGEGLAYYFTALIRDSGGYVDTFADGVRWVDIEAVTVSGGSDENLRGTSNGLLTGTLREEIVSGLLWDLTDGANEAHDTVELGVDAMMRFLTGPWREGDLADVGARGADIADVLHALGCEDLALSAGIEVLADERDLPWPPLDSEDEPTPCFKGTWAGDVRGPDSAWRPSPVGGIVSSPTGDLRVMESAGWIRPRVDDVSPLVPPPGRAGSEPEIASEGRAR